MLQTTILAPANSLDFSDPFQVSQGEIVSVGIFANGYNSSLPLVNFDILCQTPDGEINIGYINSRNAMRVLSGPVVYRVRRPSYQGIAMGVFLNR